MIKYCLVMNKNKFLFLIYSVFLSSIFINILFTNNAFATPVIESFLLNGTAQNVTFNPNNEESISIEVKANTPVKFTRLYICSINQVCNGTSGNYTRYFTQSDVSDTITKVWNGKKSGDTEIVPRGEYKIMVSMTEGTNTPVTAFGQYSIFVDFSASSTSISTSTGNNSTSTSTTTNIIATTTTITKIVYVSSHSSPEELSNYDEKIPFEVSAGRERVALVGSPIEFKAKYSLSRKGECDPSYTWSFGDGFSDIGNNISHIYKHNGEYQVILNSNCGEYTAVSRTKVQIYSPNISIRKLDSNEIEIKNNGNNEINIGNWKIKGGAKDFLISKDTILGQDDKIIFDCEEINLNSSSTNIVLCNPADKEIAFLKIEKNKSLNSETSVKSENITIAEAERLADNYKKQFIINKDIQDKEEMEKNTSKLNDESQIIQVATVIESTDSTSNEKVLSKIINFPINRLKSLVKVFYDF